MIVATPLGVGKPFRLINALYRHAADHPGTSLTIITALTLEENEPSSELARRLAGPILSRLSGGGPQPAWKDAQRAGSLPRNIEVKDFYMAPGQSLSAPVAQQSHVSANYHHVARLLAEMGTNTLVQLVAPVRDGQVSLGTNPDVSLRLLDHLERRRSDGAAVAILAEQAEEMPRLKGDALVDADRFDLLIDQTRETPLFGIPRPPVGRTESALGCLAASLLKDGGTLQIGIGSLGDAVAAAADLRHTDPERFARAIRALADPDDFAFITRVGGTEPFTNGLYAASEMVSDSLLALHDTGVVSRRVGVDPVVQEAINRVGPSGRPTVELIEDLVAMGIVEDPLTPADVTRLIDAGVLATDVSFRDGQIATPGRGSISPQVGTTLSPALATELPGPAIHGAFAAGSPDFYDRLRERAETLPVELVDVGFTNTLLGSEQLKRVQRVDARFVNATMQVTCLGEVASDTLPDGRVVSGVGGQHDFVTQAHDLEGARSVIVARATRAERGRVRSNIVWEHPHATIPRHLRDIVVTEYGIADLRGKSDAETIAAMISIADARFQGRLVTKAQKAGKLPKDFRIPPRARGNRPERVQQSLRDDPIPRYPFGTTMTDEEDELRQALGHLADLGPHPRSWPSLRSMRMGLGKVPSRFVPHLRRLGLDEPRDWKERLMAATVVAALVESGVTDE